MPLIFCEPCKNYGGVHACRRCNVALQLSVVSGRCPGLCPECIAVYVAKLEAALRRMLNTFVEDWSTHPDAVYAQELLEKRK